MSEDGLFVKLGDEFVSLSECDWVMYRPCGCSCGVSMAHIKGSGSNRRPIVTEDNAWREFFDTKREVEKYKKQGLTMELMTHVRYCAEVAPTFGKCAHGDAA